MKVKKYAVIGMKRRKLGIYPPPWFVTHETKTRQSLLPSLVAAHSAQKWLKDRKERKLEFDDILHYQKIIVALTETDKLMNEINKIDIE